MIGRRAVVRRRPLLRTAVVGGGAYAAGRASGRRQDEMAGAQTAQQQVPQQGPPPGEAPGQSAADQLSQISALHQQGALTDEEFAAAKARILGT